MKSKPNLFSIATKELSQDAFIAWLLQWADESYLETNKELNITGRKFISFLVSGKESISEIDIHRVIAERQWDNIDIWAVLMSNIF